MVFFFISPDLLMMGGVSLWFSIVMQNRKLKFIDTNVHRFEMWFSFSQVEQTYYVFCLYIYITIFYIIEINVTPLPDNISYPYNYNQPCLFCKRTLHSFSSFYV